MRQSRGAIAAAPGIAAAGVTAAIFPPAGAVGAAVAFAHGFNEATKGVGCLNDQNECDGSDGIGPGSRRDVR